MMMTRQGSAALRIALSLMLVSQFFLVRGAELGDQPGPSRGLLNSRSVRIGMAQMEPAYFDIDASIEKACKFIKEAGKNGLDLLSFPEGIISGYPWFNWWATTWNRHANMQIQKIFAENSPQLDGPEFKRLRACIKQAGVNVVMPINERDSDGSQSAVFNTAVFLDRSGNILATHRKGLPSYTERFWWTHGDQSDLVVVDMPGVGKVCALMCWENYVALAEYTVIARGCEFLIAPTQDIGPWWAAHVKTMARQGGMFVMAAGQIFRPAVLAQSTIAKETACGKVAPPCVSNWTSLMMESFGNPGPDFYGMDGGAQIVAPSGKTIAGPVYSSPTPAEIFRPLGCDSYTVDWAAKGCPGMDSGSKCEFVSVRGVPKGEFILAAVADRNLLGKYKRVQENTGNTRPRGIFKVIYNNRRGSYINMVKSGVSRNERPMYTTGQSWGEHHG